MSEYDPPKAKERVDYTGLKIGAILAPVELVFIYLGKADMGLTVFIVLAAITLAIKLRWNSRKHGWFWAIIIFLLALHVPLFFVPVRWSHGKVPTLFYAMPFAIADFAIISGALGLGEKLLSKDSFHADGQR
jgi:hypothetical protein